VKGEVPGCQAARRHGRPVRKKLEMTPSDLGVGPKLIPMESKHDEAGGQQQGAGENQA
jgi:hypothetical protein